MNNRSKRSPRKLIVSSRDNENFASHRQLRKKKKKKISPFDQCTFFSAPFNYAMFATIFPNDRRDGRIIRHRNKSKTEFTTCLLVPIGLERWRILAFGHIPTNNLKNSWFQFFSRLPFLVLEPKRWEYLKI